LELLLGGASILVNFTFSAWRNWPKESPPGLLTFSGRMRLVTHILQANPIYPAMFLSSTTKVVQNLTLLCREFLWGRSPQGGKGIPLVAWKTMPRPKAMGGLGFKDFRTHSEALLSKWVLKALDTPGSEWAQMFEVNLIMVKWRNYKSIRRNFYSTADLILLGTPVSFMQLTYTGTLWKAWSALRDYLILHPTDLAFLVTGPLKTYQG
jgi:hypothetical protein